MKPEESVGLCKYALCGIVSHSGGMSSGHYVAYVKHEDKYVASLIFRWFYISDTQVTPTTEESVRHAECYIAFYRMNSLLYHEIYGK